MDYPCVRSVVCVTCSVGNGKVATDHVEVDGCGSVDDAFERSGGGGGCWCSGWSV